MPVGDHEDLELALELADRADELTMARFRAADLVVDTKPDMTPVSEADRDVERMLRRRLAAERPGDTVLGEEYPGGEESGRGGRRWIVDPIDGTKGYVRGVPIWATLLALERSGELTVGVVSAPALGARWWALRGGGAFVRDINTPDPRPLRVSRVGALGDAQVCFGGIEEFRESGRLEGFLKLSASCWRTRGLGDFYQYMLVAEGAAEVALDPIASHWDLAAPMAIVLEAGGRFSSFAGLEEATGGSGVATNGAVHDAALALLNG
jgi:histidinol-phosphatase